MSKLLKLMLQSLRKLLLSLIKQGCLVILVNPSHIEQLDTQTQGRVSVDSLKNN